MKRTKKQLIEKHVILEKEIFSLTEKNSVLETEKAILKEKILNLNDRLFGKKREKLARDSSTETQPPLTWEEGLTAEDHAAVPPESKVKNSDDKKTRKKHKYNNFLDGLERRECVFDLSEVEKKDLIYSGEDRIEILACEPAKYYVKVMVIKKYKVEANPELGEIKAWFPESAIPGSKIDASFHSLLLVKKYCDHLPLYRLVGIFDRDGLRMTRQTMSKIVLRLAKTLKPIAQLLKESILATHRIFADETTVVNKHELLVDFG